MDKKCNVSLFNELKVVIIGKLLGYKRNKTVGSLGNSQVWGGNSNSAALHWATSYHSVTDYFPITGRPQMF